MTTCRFPSPGRLLRVFALPCALIVSSQAPAFAAASPACYYFASVEAKDAKFPKRGLDAMVILDVIRIPKDAYDRGVLLDSARSFITAKLNKFGLRAIEKNRIKLEGGCNVPAKQIANRRLSDLDHMDSSTGDPDSWIKKVAVMHGVWSGKGQDTGLSMTTLFSSFDDEPEVIQDAKTEVAQSAPLSAPVAAAADKQLPAPAASTDARAQYQEAVESLAVGSQLDALALLEKAASKGEYRARLLLVNRYRNKSWALDGSAASSRVEELRKSVEKENAFAMTMLGLTRQYGIGDVNADKLQALALYEQAARLGEPFAMTLLGRLFDTEGTPEIASDRAKALGWYRKAVAANDAQAMHHLADLYQDDQDEIKRLAAAQLRRTAADLGMLPALLKMTKCSEAECADYAQIAYRDGAPDGLAHQLFYGPQPAKEYADVKQVCQAEERYYHLQRGIFQYPAGESSDTAAYLETCTLTFGYLPAASTQQWMLEKTRNRVSLEATFRLDDFEEQRYPFTHRQRAEKKYDIAQALEKDFNAQALGYQCNTQLTGFPEGYDDLANPSRASNNWNQARTIANRFVNCVDDYLARVAGQSIETLVPVYPMLTGMEKARVFEHYRTGLDAVLTQVKRGQNEISEEFRLVQASQGRMQGAIEAARRAAAETHQWLQQIGNELAAAPVKIAQEMKRFDAALRGSTVEWEEEKARRAAELQMLFYEAQANSESSSGTGRKDHDRSPGDNPGSAGGKNVDGAGSSAKLGKAGGPAAGKSPATGATAGASGRQLAGQAGAQADPGKTAGSTLGPASTGSSASSAVTPKIVLTRKSDTDNDAEIRAAAEAFRKSELEATRAEREEAIARNKAAERDREETIRKRVQKEAAMCAASPNVCGCPVLIKVPGGACMR